MLSCRIRMPYLLNGGPPYKPKSGLEMKRLIFAGMLVLITTAAQAQAYTTLGPAGAGGYRSGTPLAPISAAAHATANGSSNEILREKPRRCRSLSSMYHRSVTSGPRPHRAVVARPARLHCKIAGRGIGIAIPKLLGCHGVAIRSCVTVFRGSCRLRG